MALRTLADAATQLNFRRIMVRTATLLAKLAKP